MQYLYNVISDCDGCGVHKQCREEIVEYHGQQRVMFMCKECDDETNEIISWASDYSNRKESR